MLGRPLAEVYIWPYAFFVANVFIVVWGLLNLIVAAIVDSNMAAREDDVASAAEIAAQTQALREFKHTTGSSISEPGGNAPHRRNHQSLHFVRFPFAM